MTSFTDTKTRTPAPLNVARDALIRILAGNGETDRSLRSSDGSDADRAAVRTEQLWDELGDFA